MKKTVTWKIWIQIEGQDEDGEVTEGDEYHEPHEVGAYSSLEKAENVLDRTLTNPDCNQNCGWCCTAGEVRRFKRDAGDGADILCAACAGNHGFVWAEGTKVEE